MITTQPQKQPKMKGLEANDLLSGILSKLYCSILLISLEDKKIEWINESLHTLKLFGKGANQVTTANDYGNLATNDMKEMIAEVQTFFYNSSDTKWNKIVRIQHSADSYLWLHITATVFERSENDIPTKSIFSIVDFTGILKSNKSILSAMQQSQQEKHQDVIQHLTKREKEIIDLLAKGLSTKQIADKLNRSFHTIETHRGNIKNKLGCANVAEITRMAFRIGLTS